MGLNSRTSRFNWEEIFVHPDTKDALRRQGDSLIAPNGDNFPIIDGIPRFVKEKEGLDTGQKQVMETFGFKWNRQDWGHEENSRRFYLNWVRSSFGCETDDEFFKFFRGGKRILDAGCGSGVIASYLAPAAPDSDFFNVDISSSIDAAAAYNAKNPNACFIQADLNRLPFPYGYFDTILSLGVLHHTPDTFGSLKNLVPYMRPGGKIFLYVYKKKAPIREFTDDYIRQEISSLEPDEAWKRVEQLTELGRYLSGLNIELNLPCDLDLLGIKKGKIDLQRFFYWHIVKCFWNDEMGFNYSTHVNFDWFYPRYAHRHTREEIEDWARRLGLSIVKLADVQSGFYVIAKRGKS